MLKLILSPGAAIEKLVERLDPYTERDREFENRFGKWRRPDFLRRYDLERLGRLIRYAPFDSELFDLAPLIGSLAPEDRRIAGEVARFVFEEFETKPATDKTLAMFRLSFLRRLNALGFGE